jgi:hypothetical protein
MAVNPDVMVQAGTPMTPGIGDTLWSLTDLAEMVESSLPKWGRAIGAAMPIDRPQALCTYTEVQWSVTCPRPNLPALG